MATTLATWTIDPVHSSVQFSLDYMGFSTYRTGFRAIEGLLEFDAARPAVSSVNAIPVASVDVTNDRLMSRLMDPDLLGGRDHPTVTFRSTRVEALDPAHWTVTGDLTIHGVAQPVVLDTLNEKISSAFRATVISVANLGIRASFALLGPVVGYGIDAWGLPSVLSGLGVLFSIAFVVLLLPLVVRERSLSLAEGVKQ